MSRQISIQMSRRMSNQSERVLPIESWGDLQKYLITNHRARQKGLKKYEKEFLARYKKRQKTKSKKKVSKLLELGDLGRLSFRKHAITKQKQLQVERKEYEKEYLARYRSSQKQSDRKKKAELKKSESYLHIPEEPKQDIKKERKLYEMEYVSRFKKIQKTKLKIAALEQKLRLSQLELDDPKQDIKKERKDYEKEYLAQYKKQQKSKPKKGHQNS